jgi:beta-fructofuranosidase
MVLALKDRWIWDSWYAQDGKRWHCCLLKADKSIGDPELRHMNQETGAIGYG